MTPQLSGILLVEDDENDVFLMQRAMSKANLASPIYVAVNGQEAVDYLSGEGKFSDRTAYPLPHCIFLDLKLPFMHGFEVLEWIRSQPSLQEINVLLLTSSAEDRDREKATQLGAKAYLVKPPTAQVLLEVIRYLPECAPQAS
jgi:CheY-like chemotaxis protein